MSEPIGVGDWVEALGSSFGRPGWTHVAPGSVHCVDGILPCGARITLVGVLSQRHPGKLAQWDINEFRPIYRPRASLIESLKAKCRTGAIVDSRDSILIPVSK